MILYLHVDVQCCLVDIKCIPLVSESIIIREHSFNYDVHIK